MAYTYERFSEIIEMIADSAWRWPDNLNPGENISDFPEFKVVFDKFGYNEVSQKYDLKNIEEYLIFVHIDSGNKGFEFPEHELSPLGIIHRPKEEVCIHAWFYPTESDDNDGEWEIADIENTPSEISPDQIMEILEQFVTNYTAET